MLLFVYMNIMICCYQQRSGEKFAVSLFKSSLQKVGVRKGKSSFQGLRAGLN